MLLDVMKKKGGQISFNTLIKIADSFLEKLFTCERARNTSKTALYRMQRFSNFFDLGTILPNTS